MCDAVGRGLAVAPDLRCVASHALRRKGQGERVRLPNRQRPHSTRRGPDLDQLRAAYEALGGAAEAFFEGLLRSHPRSAAYHAKKILGLRERYQTADLLGALAHALSYQAFQQDAIQRILVVRAQPRRLVQFNFGAALAGKGEYAGALEALADAERIWSAAFGEGHPNTAAARANLGEALVGAGQRRKGLAKMRAGVEGLVGALAACARYDTVGREGVLRLLPHRSPLS